MVEEDKQRPVNEPRPLLKRLERGADGLDTAKAKAETQSSMKTDTKEGPKETTKRQREKKESHFMSQMCFKTVLLMLFSSSKQRNHLGFQRNTDNDLTQIQVLKQSDECVWQEIKRHSRAVLQVKCQYGSLCKGI